MELKREPFNIGDVVDVCMLRALPLAERKNIQITLDTPIDDLMRRYDPCYKLPKPCNKGQIYDTLLPLPLKENVTEDTVAFLKVPVNNVRVAQGDDGRFNMLVTVNPLPVADDWSRGSTDAGPSSMPLTGTSARWSRPKARISRSPRRWTSITAG